MSGPYAYSVGDKVAEPQTYMYSRTSLSAFARGRREFYQYCKRICPQWDRAGSAEPREVDLARKTVAESVGADFQSGPLLEALLTLALAGEETRVERGLWTRIQRRFETSRRIWTAYTRDFRPAPNASYEDLDLYALVAAGFGLQLRQSGDARTLNALLKIIDTCISVAGRFERPTSFAWLLHAMEAERAGLVAAWEGSIS